MLDKFYTDKKVSKRLIELTKEKINNMNDYMIIEPSAGDGSFSDYLFKSFDNVEALDIEPDKDYITKMDYFDFVADKDTKYLVIGNPPFGRISSLAYKFLDHSMKYADYVCFLIPRTFKRQSMMKKINKNFHLLYQEDLPIGVFIPKSMSAKTVYQIWEKRNYKREVPILKDTTKDFSVLKIKDRMKSDFAIRAYGSKCGNISEDIKNLAPRSWHFIKTNINKDILIDRIRQIDFSFSTDTVRQDSVGMKELIHYYNESLTKKE